MANQEHVDRLLQGVEAWNQWRRENPEIKPDLSFADLSNANLSFANLRCTDLRSANLSNANLSNADLSSLEVEDSEDSDSRDDYYLHSIGSLLLHEVYSFNISDSSDVDVHNDLFQSTNPRRFKLYRANLSNANLSNADLSHADLSQANLHNAILHDANLSSADLGNANLFSADLSNADLSIVSLSGANLSSADLSEAKLLGAYLISTDFSEANLSKAILFSANLSHSNIRRANLENANLREANLNSADLRGTDLSGANLSAVQALNTDFNAAILNGACVEDWNINSDTNLQGGICKYIFNRYEQGQFIDRLPHDPAKFFAPGDFAKLVQQSLHTVSLIFREGLDWRSFAYSFQQLQVQYAEEQIAIHSIENKGDGTVVIKLAVAPGTDKGSFESFFWRGYEMAQKMIAGQYEARLEDKDKHINQLFALLQQLQEKLGEDSQHKTQNSEVSTDRAIDSKQSAEKRKFGRIKKVLAALVAAAVAVGSAVKWANEQTGELKELFDKLGIPLSIPIESAEPKQPSQSPQP